MPDYYGIVRNNDMLTGKSAIYTVTTQLHSPLMWKIPPVERSSTEWFPGISAEDISVYADIYLNEPELFDDIVLSKRGDRKGGVDNDPLPPEEARKADAVVDKTA